MTERELKAKLRSRAPFWLPDDQVQGLVARRQSEGGKASFVLQYRSPEGRVRKLTLGRVGALTLPDARKAARVHHGSRALGRDPALERQERRQAATVGELIDAYSERALPTLAPRTQADLQRTTLPRLRKQFGSKIARALTSGDVARWHSKRANTPVAANRDLAALSGVFSAALSWGVIESNPCRGVRRFKEQSRERFLTGDEWQRLFEALDALVDNYPVAVPAIRLLALTGARKGEILNARWEHVDWQNRVLTVPQGKTGTRRILLSTEALEVLQARKRDSAWCFPSRAKADAPLEDLRRPWKAVQEHAGFEGVRLHDLRHSAAERLIRTGASLRIVGEVLGHTRSETTRRYAHVANDVAREALERMTASVTSEGEERVQVTALRPRRS